LRIEIPGVFDSIKKERLVLNNFDSNNQIWAYDDDYFSLAAVEKIDCLTVDGGI
jgi:hypothetical protein